MSDRFCLKAFLLAGLLLSLSSCSNGPSLTAITVTPSTMNFGGAGLTTQLTAIGSYTHPDHPAVSKDITDQVNWASSTTDCVTVSSTGLITSGANVCSNILVTASAPGFGGLISGSMTVNVTQPACTGTSCGTGSTDVTTVTIIPSSQSVATGGDTGQFIAIGTTGTGASQDVTSQAVWTSSSVQVATICSNGEASPCTAADDGIATAVGPGTTTITATFGNKDGSSATGQATFTVLGSSTSPLLSLSITPGTETILQGQSSQLIAIGNFSPTSGQAGTQDLTNKVSWYSSNTSVATVTSGGFVAAVGGGTAAITAIAPAADGNLVAVATITVTPPTTGTTTEPIVSLAILPASQTSLTTGAAANVNFIAIGTTSSGATVNLTGQSYTVPGSNPAIVIPAAAWYSHNPAVASIVQATGVATPASGGTTAITAIVTNPDNTVVTAAAAYTVTVPTVTEPYVSLAILPGTQTLTSLTQQASYLAIGTTGSGASVNLTGQATWASSNNAVATPTATPGQFAAVANGTTAITASVPNPGINGNKPDGTSVTASASLTVTTAATAEPLLSIAIVPASQSVASPGESSQLRAIGTFSAVPTTQDVTAGLGAPLVTTTWSSSNTAVATVTTSCPAGLTALSCTISACPGASTNGVCSSCPAGTVAVPAGPSCAALNPTTPPGLVTGVNQGAAAIVVVAANKDNSLVTATAPFTVVGGSSQLYTALQIIPSSIAATSSAQQNQFIVLGTQGSTGLQYDITNQVVWKSETPTVATICTAGSPAPCTAATDGLATAGNAGSTLITATWTSQSGGSELVAQANYSVTIGTSPEPLISVNVIPGNVTVSNKGMTQQYLAFGTFTTTPTLRDITDSVTWITLDPNIVSINSAGTPGEAAGLATAQGYEGLGVIYAEGINPDSTVVLSNPVEFTCDEPGSSPPTCDQAVAPSLLATLTVFNAGSNDTDWLITAPSDTQATCDVITGCLIHCGPGSELAGYGNSVCTGTYAAGTTVVLTASLAGSPLDATFGGWTANCDNAVDTPNLTNTCTFPNTATPSGLVGSQSAGALFYGLTLDCSKVTSGTVGVAFNSGATATNGTPPYTYSVVGTLPAGLTLTTTTGTVAGTPTAAGSFSLTAADANGTNAATTCPITIVQ